MRIAALGTLVWGLISCGCYIGSPMPAHTSASTAEGTVREKQDVAVYASLHFGPEGQYRPVADIICINRTTAAIKLVGLAVSFDARYYDYFALPRLTREDLGADPRYWQRRFTPPSPTGVIAMIPVHPLLDGMALGAGQYVLTQAGYADQPALPGRTPDMVGLGVLLTWIGPEGSRHVQDCTFTFAPPGLSCEDKTPQERRVN